MRQEQLDELMQHVAIVPTTMAHVDDILEIDQLSFQNCYSEQVVTDKIRKQLDPGDQSSKYDRAMSCVSLTNGDVLGFMLAGFHRSRHDNEARLGKSQLTISRLAVHPSTRWRYIGTQLVETAITMADDAKATSVQIGVNCDDVSVGSLIFLERMLFTLSATVGVLNLYERRLI